jgi:hypothetical protein
MKKIFNSRTLALILVLAMAVSLFTISASAATTESLSGHGSNISSIVATGADFESVEYATSADLHGTVYDYYLAVPSGTANGTELTATFTAADGQPDGFVISKFGKNVPNPPQGIYYIASGASNTYTATMTDGAALATAYVHKDTRNEFGKCDTYNFHYYVSMPVSISTGDPVFIAWNGTTGTVAGRNGSSKIPGEFTLWVENPTSVTVNGTAQSASLQNGTNYGYTITTSEDNTLSIVVVAGGTTYTISCGTKSHTPAGSAPTSVVSYLPLGQFANNSGWGYLGTKFVGKTAPETTGVSLGAFGGFIEFYFENGIEDKATNPYGVDFVIYGNAFNGNPEAGAVQVSVDGTTWYELAGSNYYKSNFTANDPANGFSKFYTGTLRNTSVIYTKGSSRVTAKLGSLNAADCCPAAWFPLTTNFTAFENDPTGGATCDSRVSVNLSGNTLTFTGVTAIADSDTTADYAFGYADVTPNGSPSEYGEAVNPYTPYTSDKTGGDGFDLAWAVDIATGEPVNLSGQKVKYVRVYSAVLDFGRFGETSPEITGIFTARGTSSNTNPTPRAIAKLAGTTISTTGTVVSSTQRFITASVPAGTEQTLSINSSADYLYVNGVQITGTSASNPYTVSVNLAAGETATYQVITQTGTRQPYIEVIKLTGSAATRSVTIGE